MAELKFTILGEDKTAPALQSASAKISSAVSMVKSTIAGLGVTLAGVSLVSFFNAGAEAVDSFQQSVIKTAAMITSLQGGDNVAENYRKAKEYATGLQDVLMQVDANSFLSLTNLTQITEEMVKQGVILDTNNKQEIEAFTRLANAVALYSQNGAQEVQVRQEVRALLLGEVDANSQLASMLQKTVDGPLKEKVKQWKEAGTLVEELGKRLSGFGPASEDIGKTWSALTSTFETISTTILRDGFADVISDIVDKGQEISTWVKEHADIIANRITQGWMAVKGLIEGVWNFLTEFSGPLQFIATVTGGILKGWGLLLTAVFPPLMTRLGAFGQGLWETLGMLGNLARVAVNVLAGNFGGAESAMAAAKVNFANMGKATIQAFKTGLLDEIGDRSLAFLALDSVKQATDQKNTGGKPEVKTSLDQGALVKAFRDRGKEIIEIEKSRIETLIKMEQDYIKKMESEYDAHIKRLDAFKDALAEVKKAQAGRDKADADAKRGPESVLQARDREEQELFKELDNLKNSFADPAATLRGLDAMKDKFKAFYTAVEDGGVTIVSQEEATHKFQLAQGEITTAIDSLTKSMEAEEKKTIDTAQAIINAKDRVEGYKNELKDLDTLLKALPKVTNIDVNVRVNGIADLRQAIPKIPGASPSPGGPPVPGNDDHTPGDGVGPMPQLGSNGGGENVGGGGGSAPQAAIAAGAAPVVHVGGIQITIDGQGKSADGLAEELSEQTIRRLADKLRRYGLRFVPAAG